MIVTRPPDKGLVSLIITGSEAAAEAAPCLESTFNQLHPSLEVAYVDRSVEGHGPREQVEALSVNGTYIHLPGVHPADACNAGIAATNGQYVTFMGATDSWSPDKIQRQAALMEEHSDLGLVFCLAEEPGAGQRGALLSGNSGWRRLFQGGIGLDDPAALYAHMVLGELVPVATVLVRRVALPLDGPFRGEKAPAHDYDFILRMSELARFAFIDEKLVTLGEEASDPADPGARAIVELEIFEDNVGRNPWLLARDRAAMSRREQALLKAAGLGQAMLGEREEARRLLKKAWKKSPWDLKVSAALLRLAGKPEPGPPDERKSGTG